VISPEGQSLFDDWCSLFKVKVSLGEKTVEAAEKLIEPCNVWTQELGVSRPVLLKNIKDWLYQNDKNGYYSRGVKLTDCWREFEAWQSAQERPSQAKTNGHRAMSSPPPAPGDSDYYSIPALIARKQANPSPWVVEAMAAMAAGGEA
jgi:hypothetical protein